MLPSAFLGVQGVAVIKYKIHNYYTFINQLKARLVNHVDYLSITRIIELMGLENKTVYNKTDLNIYD